MSTISENLQTIKSSTDAIKQAIIDKGGAISGDITTWASAISGIEVGGGSAEEYVFNGIINYKGSTVTIIGNLNKIPDTGRNYLSLLGAHPVEPSKICYTNHYIYDNSPWELTVDFEESNGETPAICILNIMGNTHTIIPVKFIPQTGHEGGVTD